MNVNVNLKNFNIVFKKFQYSVYAWNNLQIFVIKDYLFFMYFNSVLVYIIIIKGFVTYLDWVEKFRSSGHTIQKNKIMTFIHVLLNMCLEETLKVYRLILERSLLMVLFLSLSFLSILSLSNLDWVTSSFQVLTWFDP